MTLDSLREKLESFKDLPGNTPIVVESSDHEYRNVGIFKADAGLARGKMSEWHGEENASPGEVPIKVLVIT